MFYASGTIDAVAVYAATLESSALKIGGTLGIVLIGMITGSQTTAQTVMVTFIAPALESLGVHTTNIALGASHIAAAGQNFPPVGLTAFVVCGIVAGR
ncbi:hypothetical protein [Geomicrobium sp. JCM 19038]|uniref:hypothetical protein n=1 Tax=Geomicrobium sp. JCM 19038 TaxID=1460635 RepID=UPI00045F12F1|nr:hypothetical protein [Geomicrobium sp. JCM 19038]GAK07930.1 hypothetical protein JCM19038_1684 [Geomicrobium sp. JCM 19038]